jgi:hypothetical protein
VYESGNGEFRVAFADGSLIASFCESRLAKMVAWLLNRHHSFDTLLYCVSEILRRVKLIEDCEHNRFVHMLALKACNGDDVNAHNLVKQVMLDLQEERDYV